MKIQNVNDASFKKYGKILKGYPVDKILKEMQHTPLPDDVIYVSSVDTLEATSFHYAPCNAEGKKGFRCVVILPKGTNEELTFTPDKDGEDKLLTAQNKWLIAHEEAKIPEAFCGLVGENITLD